jgi:hypothetical protein
MAWVSSSWPLWRDYTCPPNRVAQQFWDHPSAPASREERVNRTRTCLAGRTWQAGSCCNRHPGRRRARLEGGYTRRQSRQSRQSRPSRRNTRTRLAGRTWRAGNCRNQHPGRRRARPEADCRSFRTGTRCHNTPWTGSCCNRWFACKARASEEDCTPHRSPSSLHCIRTCLAGHTWRAGNCRNRRLESRRARPAVGYTPRLSRPLDHSSSRWPARTGR